MWWYRLRGWRVLGENVWAGGNELDLVVRRGRTLRFVEVILRLLAPGEDASPVAFP